MRICILFCVSSISAEISDHNITYQHLGIGVYFPQAETRFVSNISKLRFRELVSVVFLHAFC